MDDTEQKRTTTGDLSYARFKSEVLGAMFEMASDPMLDGAVEPLRFRMSVICGSSISRSQKIEALSVVGRALRALRDLRLVLGLLQRGESQLWDYAMLDVESVHNLQRDGAAANTYCSMCRRRPWIYRMTHPNSDRDMFACDWCERMFSDGANG